MTLQDQRSRENRLVAVCYQKPSFDSAAPIPVARGDNYFNVPGVGSGRCEAGIEHSIRNLHDCYAAVESMGHEVKTTTTVNAWSKVCGCSYNPEEQHLQFNQFVHPHYCYPYEGRTHMDHQDLNSRQERLVAVCHHPVTESPSNRVPDSSSDRSPDTLPDRSPYSPS